MSNFQRSVSQTSTTSTNDDSAYISTANQLTGYLYSEVESFYNLVQEEAEVGDSTRGNVGKWRFEGVKKGVRVYKTASDFQSKTPCMLGRIQMRCQPAYLASYLQNPQTRYYYDNSLKESKLLQTVNEHIKVYYTVFQTKKCLVNYNVSICNIAAQRKEGETFVTGYCSVPPHKNMIVETGVPTIWVHYSGFVIKPYQKKDGTTWSDVFYIFQFDFKGDLPTFLINFALERQMTQLANIKIVLEKCLLSPGFSDSGDSLSTMGHSRQNSDASRASDSSRNLIRLPSTTSLGSIGMGRRTTVERCDSFSSARSVVISNNNSSPPLSMKSFSEPLLGGEDPLVLFYVDSGDEEQSIRSSQESLMQSIMIPGDNLPESLLGNLASQNSIVSNTSDSSTFLEHQYEATAKRASADLYKEYVGIIESVRFSSANHSSLPWKVIDQKRGVWILENTNADKLHICGVTRVNTDCDTLVEYLGNLSNKIEFDKFLHKAMVVEEINENLQILYMQFKTKHCLMVQYERDACVFQYLCRKDKKAVLVNSSVNHSNCPPVKDIARLQVDLSGFIVEALPNDPGQCSLVFVSKVNMGPGYFPHSLLWLIKRRQPLLLARIAAHFKSEK